jgi:hypothetical protein
LIEHVLLNYTEIIGIVKLSRIEQKIEQIKSIHGIMNRQKYLEGVKIENLRFKIVKRKDKVKENELAINK